MHFLTLPFYLTIFVYHSCDRHRWKLSFKESSITLYCCRYLSVFWSYFFVITSSYKKLHYLYKIFTSLDFRSRANLYDPFFFRLCFSGFLSDKAHAIMLLATWESWGWIKSCYRRNKRGRNPRIGSSSGTFLSIKKWHVRYYFQQRQQIFSWLIYAKPRDWRPPSASEDPPPPCRPFNFHTRLELERNAAESESFVQFRKLSTFAQL